MFPSRNLKWSRWFLCFALLSKCLQSPQTKRVLRSLLSAQQKATRSPSHRYFISFNYWGSLQSLHGSHPCWNVLPVDFCSFVLICFLKWRTSHTRVCLQTVFKNSWDIPKLSCNFNSLPSHAPIFCVMIQSLIRPLQLQTCLGNESGLCGKRHHCPRISTPFLAGVERWTVNEVGVCGKRMKY